MVKELYKIPNGSRVCVVDDIQVPPTSPEIKKGDEIYFSHIDGMYSLCFDKDKNPIHLAAWSLVEVIDEQESF